MHIDMGVNLTDLIETFCQNAKDVKIIDTKIGMLSLAFSAKLTLIVILAYRKSPTDKISNYRDP